MSTYNDGVYLKTAIDSIINQTYKNIEFIIVNDGADLNTAKTLREYSKNYKTVSIIEQDNHGLSYSLNKAISHSKGEYIARQDGDDYSNCCRIEKQVKYMLDNTDCGLLGCNSAIIDEDNNKISETNYPIVDNELRKYLINNSGLNPFVHGSVMIPRIVLNEVDFYREEFKQAQDFDLWLRIIEKYKISNLEDPLYSWRLRRDSVAGLKWEKQRDFAKLALECYQNRINNTPEPVIDINKYEDRLVFRVLSIFRISSREADYYSNIGKILLNDNKITSRIYLLKSIKIAPFNFYSWFLFALTFLPRNSISPILFSIRSIYRKVLWGSSK